MYLASAPIYWIKVRTLEIQCNPVASNLINFAENYPDHRINPPNIAPILIAMKTNALPTRIQTQRVNFSHADDRRALVMLLDHYALDPMGGSTPLSDDVKARLCDDLATLPNAVSFLAWDGTLAIGLINCFEGYSTFKAKPLLNVHDIIVHSSFRRQGIGQVLLSAAQDEAQRRGCCKLTLEVLTGNTRAMASYEHFGFAGYQLDPAAGHAVLMQKWL